MSRSDTVRTMFEAYLSQDLATAQSLLAPAFVFTSPQDDHIDKQAFLQRVFVRYEYELKTGDRHRNTEVSTVHDGQLTETQVFFGGKAS